MKLRDRSRVLSPTAQQALSITQTVPGSSTRYEGPFVTSFENESMVDIVVPGFRRKVRAGNIIENPCTYQKSSLSSTGNGMTNYVGKDSSGTVVLAENASGPLTARVCSLYGFEAPFTQQAIGTSMTLSECEQLSKVRALAAIDSTPLSTGEDLAELGETLRFLKSPLRGIFNALSRKGITKIADLSADVWLSLRFGITPLVMSIDQILREVKQPTAKPPTLRTARGFSSTEGFLSGSKKVGTMFYYNIDWYSEVSITTKSTIHYQLRSPTYDWRWRYGLRNKDILPTFWAVMPLSFMVDRIWDVSSMVAACQNLADPSVQILGATTTTRVKIKTDTQVVSGGTTVSDATMSAAGETRTRDIFTYTRTPYTPSISDVTPPVDPDGFTKNLTQVTDLLALLWARLR